MTINLGFHLSTFSVTMKYVPYMQKNYFEGSWEKEETCKCVIS